MIYQYQEREYKRKKRHSSFFRKISVLIIFCVVVYGILTTTYTFLKTLTKSSSIQKYASPMSKILPISISSGLEKAVKDSLKGTFGSYAVVIKNLKTSEMYLLNEDKEYEAASLYKLWVMLTVMDQIDRGILDKKQTLKAGASELNDKFDIASEEAEMSDGDIEMTVDEALERMITISHNYAALLLTSEVKVSNIRQEMDKYGFVLSKLDPPRTTASDISDFYEKLYKGELIDKKRSGEMLDLLKRQQLNDRIPLYLPESVKVGHKTGEIGPYKHDAGIVFTDKGDYIIVLLSKSEDPKAAAEREALVSKAVYVYFQNK